MGFDRRKADDVSAREAASTRPTEDDPRPMGVGDLLVDNGWAIALALLSLATILASVLTGVQPR